MALQICRSGVLHAGMCGFAEALRSIALDQLMIMVGAFSWLSGLFIFVVIRREKSRVLLCSSATWFTLCIASVLWQSE